jgi:TPR repeat protein
VGGPANDDVAKELLAKAANAGYVDAMVPLSFIYAQSQDSVSQSRAVEWAGKAAAANVPEGHLILGYLWNKGLMSLGDDGYPQAFNEYKKAADVGNCVAMMNIGGLYFNGSRRFPQNASQAQAWFAKAETCQGNNLGEMRAKAAKYRALAVAGHLPAPSIPALPSRGVAGTSDLGRSSLLEIGGSLLSLGVLAVAELAAHPELANQAPAGTPYGTDDSPNALWDRINTQQRVNDIWAGKSFDWSYHNK